MTGVRRLVTIWASALALLLTIALVAAPTARADEDTSAYVSINFKPVQMQNDIGTLNLSATPHKPGDPKSYYCNLQINLQLSPSLFPDSYTTTEMEMSAKINGKSTGWHYHKLRYPRYQFHTSLATYKNKGDALWTDHRLHRGDVVDLEMITQSSNGAQTVTGVSTANIHIQ